MIKQLIELVWCGSCTLSIGDAVSVGFALGILAFGGLGFVVLAAAAISMLRGTR